MVDDNPKSFKVTFDKKKLLAKAHKFTFREARRNSGNFYDALVQELLEDGCTTTAKYFKILSNKETDYYESNIIRDRVKNEPMFILRIFDNCKMAESTALLRQCGGIKVTFCLLYQVMCLMEQEPYATKFKWLIKDVFEIIVRICDKLGLNNTNIEKPLCEIYYKYANFLREDDAAESALQYYEKALSLSKANHWTTESLSHGVHQKIYIHIELANILSQTLVDLGRKIASFDYKQAVTLGVRALVVLSEAGYKENKLNLTLGRLNIAEFYIEGDQFAAAFNILDNLDQELQREHIQTDRKVDMRLNLFKGICFVNLGQSEKAMECLRCALRLSQNLKLKSIEGVTHMNMGKLYFSKGGWQRVLAKRSFKKSMQIFDKLNDIQNRRKNLYLLANVMSESLSIVYIDLLKRSDKHNNFFSLRRWKYILKPFWPDLYLTEEKMDNDKVLCLLEEFNDKSNIQSNLFEV